MSLKNFNKKKGKMNKPIKPGLTIIKTLVYNRTGNDADEDASGCRLSFSNNSDDDMVYDIDSVEELENENAGIYELLSDGTYKQIEDWEN